VTSIAQRAAGLLGTSVRRQERLSGGDLSAVMRVVLADGRMVIAKQAPLAGTEAGMLRAMMAAGAPVPDVLACDNDLLIMTEAPASGAIAWDDLGAALARLHAVEGQRYGWEVDYAFGACPIVNRRTDDWPAFWADNRLVPFVSQLSAATARRVERLADGLGDRLPARPKPSLLHGDLWTGNVLSDGRRVTLIDPACYYGHGEVDIAMLHLFGHPEAAFYDACPLEPDWRERLPVYSLWPALVHFRLFGAGYLGMVERFLTLAGV